MTQEVTSAKPMTVGYLSVVWQNVVKIFLIDLLGAAVVLCTTFVLAVLLYAIAHVVWGLRFHIVAESLLYLAAIYVGVIFATAVKRHFTLGIAIVPKVGATAGSGPEAPNPKSTLVVDAGIPTSVSGS
jgi:hypothetical protein